MHLSFSGFFGRLGRALACATGGLALLAAAPGATFAAPLQVAMMEGASPCVALTFDDGPDVDLTPRLLGVLEAKGVNATFFVVGYRAAAWPSLVARADHDGDEIGNHSWDHPVLPSLSSDQALSELTRTDETIRKIIGHAPTYTRAPYGSLSLRVAGLSARTFVAWNVDTLDWKYRNVDYITNAAVSKAVNGSIILMHDIHPRTIDAVPGIIDGLRQRGFRLVTVSELLGGGCGGRESGFGVQVPGETPLDPFGVNQFQGQQVASPGGKAPSTPTTATSAAPKTTANAAAVAAVQPAAAPMVLSATAPVFRVFPDDN